jgi:hypothetical protein
VLFGDFAAKEHQKKESWGGVASPNPTTA